MVWPSASGPRRRFKSRQTSRRYGWNAPSPEGGLRYSNHPFPSTADCQPILTKPTSDFAGNLRPVIDRYTPRLPELSRRTGGHQNVPQITGSDRNPRELDLLMNLLIKERATLRPYAGSLLSLDIETGNPLISSIMDSVISYSALYDSQTLTSCCGAGLQPRCREGDMH